MGKKSRSNLCSNLSLLGFRTVKEYTASTLYLVIRRVILRRDNFTCRVVRCRGKAITLAFLHPTLHSLVGITPGIVFSVCRDCCGSLKSDVDVWNAIVGIKREVSKSNNVVGQWYATQLHGPYQRLYQEEIQRQLTKLNLLKQYWENEYVLNRLSGEESSRGKASKDEH